MGRKLKVYGWLGRRGGAQTREICAAPSKVAVVRIVGGHKSDLFNLGETGNDDEVETALAHPGVVFWKPIDHSPRGGGWTRAEGGDG